MTNWTEEDQQQFDDHVGKTPLQMVKEYHAASGLAENVRVTEASPSLKGLRLGLIAEEYEELCNEFNGDPLEYDKVNMLKELADLVYVIYGMAVSFGWDLDEAVRRVHENNMGRMKQPDGTIKRREDGKIMKNLDYPKVDMGDLV